jgi:hypothetical protein
MEPQIGSWGSRFYGRGIRESETASPFLKDGKSLGVWKIG